MMTADPIQKTLAGANRHDQWLPVAVSAINASESLAAQTGDGRLAAWGRAFGESIGASDPRVGPTLLFEQLMRLIALSLIGPYIFARRVPLIESKGMQPVSCPELRATKMLLSPAPFACLPRDIAAGHGSAVKLDTSENLFSCLRERLVMVSEPLVHGMAQATKRGIRTQWRSASDMIVNMARNAGINCGNEAAGMALAERLCDGREPLIGRPGFRTFEYEGATYIHRVRNSCCQQFRVPERRLCLNCPLVKADQRENYWRQIYDERKTR